MHRLELKHLRSLIALRRHGSLVEAANALHMTQSALSHQLRELEERLNLELVERRFKPLRFTPAGERVLALADAVLPAFESTEKALRDEAEGRHGRLHIAIECHSCFDWLMPTLDDYRESWPDIEIDLVTGFNFDPLPALKRGEVDLVITSDPQPISGIVYEPLFQYESLLCLAKQHPLAQQDTIAAADLVNETLITYPVEHSRLDIFKQVLTPAGLAPKHVRTAELTTMIIQLIASQRGVGALPNWALAEYLNRGFVTAKSLGAGVWVTLHAALRSDQLSSAYMRAFVDTAREVSLNALEGVKAPIDA